MQHDLTLTNPAARHPLRQALPPPVVRAIRNQDQDLKLFVLSFTAFFICIYSFIF